MNGKIKTKFAALFAVALMITVCVVPMVGGSEDVEAATNTDTIDISGTVFKADGSTEWDDIEVYIEGTDISDITDDTNAGEFELEDVPVKDTIIVKVNVGEYLSNGTENEAYGYSFASITLTKVTEDVEGLEFVAGTIKISGNIQVGSDVIAPITSVAIKNGTTEVAKTKADGSFEFIGVAGQIYELNAVVGGAEFKWASKDSSGNLVALDDDVLNASLVSEDLLLYSNIVGPFGDVTVDNSGDSAIIKLATEAFVKVGNSYKVLAKVTKYSGTGTPTNVTIKMSYKSGTQTFGLLDPNSYSVTSSPTNNLTPDFKSSANAYIGTVSVGGSVSIEPSAVTLKSKDSTQSSVSIPAKIIGSEWFVGPYFSDTEYVSQDNVEIQVSEYSGFTFDAAAYNATLITPNNAKMVTVNADVSGVEFTVNAYNAIVGEQGYVTGSPVGGVASFSFYVPSGTEVTVTAPANFKTEKVQYSSVIDDVSTPLFTYIPKVTYTGQVLLNGVPIVLGTPDPATKKEINSFSFSVDSGESWVGAEVYWKVNEEGAPYYTIALDREYDSSEILFRIKTGPNGVQGGYQFDKSEEGNYTSSVGITGTTIGTFNVKASELTVTAKDNSLLIPGMEFVYYMLKDNNGSAAASFNEDLVIAELGKATTDAEGKAILNAAMPNSSVDKYTIFAVTDGQSDFGKYPEKKTNNVTSGTAAAEFNNMTIYGFYTADATIIPGMEISYTEKDGANLVGSGKATIIDNMYYIVLKKAGNYAYLSVDESKYDPDFSASYNSGLKNIVIEVVADNLSVTVEILENEYFKFIEVNEYPANPVKGDVIVLSAEKTCYKLNDGTFGYQYADAAVEYTFAGWYVNGKLLTEDCDTAITLSENVVIVAQYDEAVKVIGSQDVPEAGLDTNVLILGIVVVVIALIAVVYSVISKRD